MENAIPINACVSVKSVGEKDYIWNPATCSCQNGKYSASIIDDSAITSDEILTQNVSSTIKKQKLSYKF